VLSYLGPYEILEELARGGMGVVYRARHTQLNRQVAIKVLVPHGRGSQRARQRFLREVRAQGKLRHPNIVSIHDAGEDQGSPYLVMDLVEGASLEQRLRRGGPLGHREAAALVAAVARGLAHAHKHGVLHRDIKPANVLLDRDGRPHLTDFGLTRAVDPNDQSRVTREGIFLGTAGYLSPEQAAGQLDDVGPRSDVFGLGALLFASLTSHPPFEADSVSALLARLSQPAPAPSELRDDVPAQLDAICARCLALQPDERYPDALSVAEALEAFADPPRQGRSRAARGAGGLAAFAGLLVVSVGVGVALARRGSPGATPPPSASATESPLTQEALVQQLEALVADDDWETLLAQIEQAPTALTRDPQVQLLRGRGLLEEREAADALALYEGLLREGDQLSDAQRAEALSRRGQIHLAENRLPQAASDADQALRLDPKQSLAWSVRAAAFSQEARLDEAMEAAEKAVSLNPDSTIALYIRGQLRRQGGDAAGAIQDAERLQSLDELRGAILLASALLGTGRAADLERALSQLADLRQRFPDDDEVLYVSALAAAQSGDPRRALSWLNELLVDHPDDVNALLTRAQLLARTGQLERALPDARRAFELQPTNHLLAEFLVEMLFANRTTEGLLEPARVSAEANPDDPEKLKRLAMALTQAAELTEAVAVMERALALGLEEDVPTPIAWSGPNRSSTG
jgi:tetratricopeptide (TPR) repeat protein/tRNA A-37 threonylcarbamoyl transferase component Bud32